MKVTCDFCKTEYSLDSSVRGAVKCAVCGHTWAICPPRRRGVWLTFVASLTAALAAIVFSVVVILHHQANRAAAARPLTAAVTNIDSVVDAAGVRHLVVSGTVINQSADIYGVPDLIIVSRDGNGNEIAQQKFMPSATLLEPGASVEFKHTLASSADGVKKITVELKDQIEVQ